MAIAHPLHGFIGTGKTTYARQLETQIPALRLSIDDWMIALYGQNPPAAQFEEYRNKTAGLVWAVAARTLELGQDVILDFGFWSRESRDDARQKVCAVGATPVLYDVSCTDAAIRERVLRRAAELPEHSLYIDAEAIKTLQKQFEPLENDESHQLVRTDS